MNEPNNWDKIVMKAFLTRLSGEQRNPVRAYAILRRFGTNVHRVQVWHEATREQWLREIRTKQFQCTGISQQGAYKL